MFMLISKDSCCFWVCFHEKKGLGIFLVSRLRACAEFGGDGGCKKKKTVAGKGKPPGGVTRLDYHVCTFIYDLKKKKKKRKKKKKKYEDVEQT